MLRKAARFLSRWTGMLLCGIGLIATLVLAAAGDLTLYIHPRYVVFTVVMTVIGAVLFGLAVWYTATPRPSGHGHEHDHDHDHDHDHEHDRSGTARWRSASTVSRTALVIVVAFGLLVAPPATLSAERALSSETATDGGGDVPAPVLLGSDPTRFSIRDWATILGTGATSQQLVGRRADITGMVLLDDPRFPRIARYAVTCCTVDAQLFAVPVDRDTLPPGVTTGDWVHVTGTFADSGGTMRLVADSAEEVSEPDDPYIS